MTQSVPPSDLPENETDKMRRLTEAVMSGLYDEARTYYINLLLGIWSFGARRDQLLSDIRPVEEIGFSETALDSLLNDGTFVLVAFDAPHPYNEGETQRRELVFHRDNTEKVDVHVNPGKYRRQWEEFQTERRKGYESAEVNPTAENSKFPLWWKATGEGVAV